MADNNSLNPNLRMIDKQHEPVINVLDILNAIYQYKWSVLLLSLIIMLLTILVVFSIEPVYRSTATIVVDQGQLSAVGIDKVYDDSNTKFGNHLALLQSRKLAKRVVEKLNLIDNPLFNPLLEKKPEESALSALKGLLFWKTRPDDVALPSQQDIYEDAVNFVLSITKAENNDGTIIEISAEYIEPELATIIANTLTDEYIASLLDKKNNLSVAVTQWINSRLAELKDTLQKSQYALQQYREEHNMIGTSASDTNSPKYNQLLQSTKLLLDAKIARKKIVNRYNQAKLLHEIGGWRGQLSLPEIANDPVVITYLLEEAKARTAVTKMQLRYGEKHPDMVVARLLFDSTTTRLEKQIKLIVETLNQKYQLALKEEQELLGIIDQEQNHIQSVKRKQFKMLELQQEVEANSALYDTFLARLKETLITSSQSNLDPSAQIVDRASLPTSPFKPNKKIIIFFMFILSLVLGTVLAIFLHMLDSRLKTVLDVEKQLHIPVIGSIPKYKKGSDSHTLAHLAMIDKGGPFAEAILSLRTSIVLAPYGHKSILVTSSRPGEGKTTVASSLALALAQIEKVLLIDMDLRKPTLASNFGLPLGSNGIANLLAGTASIDECIYKIEDDKIDIMPTGMAPPNPLSLLLSESCGTVISDLGSRYDRIIVDSPPVGAVSDPLVLSKIVDAVVYVINSGHTPSRLAQRSVGEILQNNASVLGAVINQVKYNKQLDYMTYYYGNDAEKT